MDTTTLLLLADGRFPSGGHAHSSGLEAAVAAGRVTDVDGLAAFLSGRLATAGRVAAAFAAAAHLAATPAGHPADADRTADGERAADTDRSGAGDHVAPGPGVARARDALVRLDAELDARTAAPAARLASRRQGRALLRAARTTWPSPLLDLVPRHSDGCHQPIALGVTAAAAGLTVDRAALIGAYGTVTGPAGAAVRLLGLDPYRTQAVLARLAGACDAVAGAAVLDAAGPPAALPAHAAPLADIHAEVHATWEVRLFAS
ncbi:urease accessory protein UreF [Micromonospora zhanjiangensis]|uniref:Urease accessory protein UreF n=1 Tax=Micromonospora zhanjiangensis TaxID=1522057 RepID=A0ABV8KW93_9ACTN